MDKKIVRPPSFLSEKIDIPNPEDVNMKSQDVLQTILQISNKPFSTRTSQEINYFYDCISNLKCIRHLAENVDKQSIRWLIKSSKVINIDSRKLLFTSNAKNQNFYILIKGRIELTSSHHKALDQQTVTNLLFYMILHMINPAKKHSRTLKDKLEQKHHYQRLVYQGQSFGDEALKKEQIKSYDALSIESSYLLQIPLQVYGVIFKQYNDQKIIQMKVTFRKFRCLDILEDIGVMKLIKQTKEMVKDKKYTIYKEGDFPSEFFILKKGEVRITKKGQPILFKQKQIPSGLYLSHGKKTQNIVISILNNQNMFGEEDILSHRRTTSAEIISEQAIYYSIQIEKLENVLKCQNYNLKDFYDYIEIKSKKKINYRINRFSDVLNIRKKHTNIIDQPFKISKTPKKVLSQSRCKSSRLQTRELTFSKTMLQSRSSSRTNTHFDLDISNSSRQSPARRLKSASSANQSDISFTNPLFQLNYFRDYQRQCRKLVKISQKKLAFNASPLKKNNPFKNKRILI